MADEQERGQKKPRLLLGSILTLAGVYLGIRYGLPRVAVWVGLSEQPAPIPAFAQLMYLACALVGVLVYVSSNDRRWRLFLGPMVRLFVPPAHRSSALRILVLAALPILAGWTAWRRVMPRTQPPAALRVQHPAMPRAYAELRNSFRDLAEPEQRAVMREGIILYQKNCRPCHGTKAGGDGPLARGLRLRPANFQDRGTIATVVEPFALWRIKQGGVGLPQIATPWHSAMPAWEDELQDDEIWKIIMAEYAIAGKEPRKPEGSEQ